LPQTAQQEKDQWLRRWSQATGYDLTRYMVDLWGLEVSAAGRAAVQNLGLPDWLPLATSLERVEAFAGQSLTVDLGAAAIALDGNAILLRVEAPDKGTLVAQDGGVYVYTPPEGFAGDDSFVAIYQTAAGNEVALSTRVVVGDGVVGWWKFDEGEGAVASDARGNADGALVGPTWTDGRGAGSSLHFDGVNDYVALGTAPALSGSTSFTVSAWVRTTAGGRVIQQRNGGFNGEYWVDVQPSGRVEFGLFGDGAYQWVFNTTATVNDGQWHQVVVQRDGTAGRIYIDGVLRANASGPVRNLDPTISVAVGADIRDHTRYFAGEIDDVRIYSYAADLTVPELRGDFNLSGEVDGADLRVWEAAFGSPGPVSPQAGDATLDGLAAGDDFLLWQQGFRPVTSRRVIASDESPTSGTPRVDSNNDVPAPHRARSARRETWRALASDEAFTELGPM
ncbi:MAG: hypothetical protein KDA61_14655, partial [Planctomycetales bacterium]|nr:hypothetical protein [Planctomycetales bacterium]